MKLKANGISMEYQMRGPDGAPVVTLSHSLATSSAMWSPQVDELVSSYRVLTYDTRGHGGSDVPSGPYSLAQLADDVRGLLDALGVAKTYFVGLSMGGIIGQQFALTYPERLLGLVLCSTTARMTPDAPAVWDERIRVAQTQGMGPHMEPTIGRWFTPSFVDRHPEVIDVIRETIRRTDPAGYVACIEAIRHTDFLDRLAELTMPVLVVAGRDDPGMPACEAIHQRIAGSELVVLSPAAHLCNLEQPAAFNAALLAFLSRT